MIKWLLQSVGKHKMIEDNFNTLKYNKSNYCDFALISETQKIINLENILTALNESYILRGSVKIVSMIDTMTDIEQHCTDLTPEQIEHKEIFLHKLKSSIFYDRQKFDQAYYSTLDLPLLNSGAFFVPIEDNLQTSFSTPYFIKPSQDLKSFLPGILKSGQTVQNFVENSSYTPDYKKEILLVSPVIDIKEEYRFFVINEEIITGSLYKKNDKVIYNSYIPDKILGIAKDYAKLYQPSSIYTMDIAITQKGAKIVEYNCWNGSGLYHCDKPLLFQQVESYIKNRSLSNKNKYSCR